MKTKLTPLTDTERTELFTCEEALSQKDCHFVTVGDALTKVQAGTLYRSTHTTFARYARERWDMSRAYAYAKIAASKTMENLSANADILPINEAQARPLSRLTPEEQHEAWARVLAESHNKPTGKAISEVVAAYRPKPVSTRQAKESHWETEKLRADGLEGEVIELKTEVTRLQMRIQELEAGTVMDTAPTKEEEDSGTAEPSSREDGSCPLCNASDWSQCDCDADVVNTLLLERGLIAA